MEDELETQLADSPSYQAFLDSPEPSIQTHDLFCSL